MENSVFVTIGHPSSQTAKVEKIMVFTESGISPKFVAKDLRKVFAKSPVFLGFHCYIRFNPSDLFWAVFASPDDQKPVLASDNWYWRRK